MTDSYFDDCPETEAGFAPPSRRPLGEERGPAALASLLASLALVVATLLVITASFGVVRTGDAELRFQQSTQIGASARTG